MNERTEVGDEKSARDATRGSRGGVAEEQQVIVLKGFTAAGASLLEEGHRRSFHHSHGETRISKYDQRAGAKAESSPFFSLWTSTDRFITSR